MSSNHLPRLLITAARNSFGCDGRKMSFLSADGRLEDRGSRRESRDSHCSLESDVSLRIGMSYIFKRLKNFIGNGSDISDESALVGHSGNSSCQVRRKSWMEMCSHSISMEQSSNYERNFRYINYFYFFIYKSLLKLII